MTIQVVCVINLTSTKTREDKNAEQSLEARKAAYAEVEKACTWYVIHYECETTFAVPECMSL